jgi:hypothetical protein
MTYSLLGKEEAGRALFLALGRKIPPSLILLLSRLGLLLRRRRRLRR